MDSSRTYNNWGDRIRSTITSMEQGTTWVDCRSFGHVVLCVRLNLINHVLALFHDKFACNTALRNLVFRWKSCKGSV